MPFFPLDFKRHSYLFTKIGQYSVFCLGFLWNSYFSLLLALRNLLFCYLISYFLSRLLLSVFRVFVKTRLFIFSFCVFRQVSFCCLFPALYFYQSDFLRIFVRSVPVLSYSCISFAIDSPLDDITLN